MVVSKRWFEFCPESKLSVTPFLPQCNLLFTSILPLFNLFLTFFKPQFNLCFVTNLEPRFGNHGLHTLGLPNLTLGYFFLFGRSVASKIIYVRPVGSPENTLNIGDIPNINNLACPWTLTLTAPPNILQKLFVPHFRL